MKKIVLFLSLLTSLNTFSQLPSYIPTNGLVAFYSFTGNSLDSSGNGNHTSNNGAILTTDRFAYPDNAYSFDGINDYLNTNNGFDLSFSSDFTFSCWIMMNNLPSAGSYYVFKSSSTTGGLSAVIASNRISIGRSLINEVVSFNCSPVANIWYNIVFVRSGTIVHCYLNGIDIGSGTLSTSYTSGNMILGIDGNYYDFPQKGKIDEVGVWSRALTQNEILLLYDNFNYPNIIANPTNNSALVHDTVTFVLQATGDSLNYQWQKDGINISGATNDSLVINNVLTSNIGSYRCIVSNSLGADTSSNASLNVIIFTLQTSISMAGIKDGAIYVGDYNNDGNLDLILTGYDNTSGLHRKIYKNNGDNTFSLQLNYPGIYHSSVKWGDYDNDGDLDLLLSGFLNGAPNITKVYKNNGNNSFSDLSNLSLPGYYYTSVDWGDYDNDGDLDFLLTGMGDNYTSYTKIFKNSGNDNFAEQSNISLPGVSYSAVSWIDYDNDGDLDIFLSGSGSSGTISRIYRNNGNNSFAFQNGIIIAGVTRGSVDWGDYNNDGYQDLIITGVSANYPYTKISKVYKNNGPSTGSGWTFSEQTNISLTGVYDSDAKWGDYDNDGDLDILLTGKDNSGYRNTKIYTNTGNNTFTVLTGQGFDMLSNSSVAWMDYDNDGDLDILLTGERGNYPYENSKIYKNNINNSNQNPTIPSNLSSDFIGDSIIQFHWSPGNDDLTTSNSLTYKLRIGSTYNGVDIKSPMSHIQTGKNLLAKNAMIQDTSWILKIDSNISQYPIIYWSVQAVDQNYNASPFSLADSVLPTYFYSEKDTLCSGVILTWHGMILSQAGVYYDSLTTIYGVDSIYKLTLTVYPSYLYTETDTICDNGSLLWHGSTYSLAGIYYDSLTTVNGCDSIYQLTLTVNPTYFYSETDTICDNGSLLWHGSTLATAGVYYDSLLSINGCDSVYELTLTVNPTYFYAETDTICDNGSLLWHGSILTTAGVYYDSLLSTNGCDSVYQLSLTVNPTYFYAETDTICDNGNLIWHGSTLTAAGVYYDSLLSMNGCDSIYQLSLTVNPTYFYAETDTICDNGSLLWHGSTLATAGVYYDSLLSTNGCDSVYELTLTVNPTYFYAETDTICDNGSLLWHGSILTTAGVYYDSLLSTNGCDSVYELTLTINPTYYFVEMDTICYGDFVTWQWINVNYYSVSDTFYANYNSINGCDSIYELQLFVNLPYYFVDQDTVCNGDSLLWQGNYYSVADTFYANYNSINGCDSIYQLQLIVNPTYYFVEQDTICNGDSLLWQGNYYSATGTYNANYNSINGCDSLYQLSLTVNPTYFLTETDTICDNDSLLWHSSIYTTAGVYYDSLLSMNGCDSIYQLTLIVNPKPINFVISGNTNVVEFQTETYNVVSDTNVYYFWYASNGVILSHPTNNSAVIQWGNYGSGSVSVFSINIFGCISDTAQLNVIIGAIGINENILPDIIKVYPNPSKGIFNYEIYDISDPISIEIYNSIGECVSRQQVNSKESKINGEIDMSKFPKGIYFLKIENDTISISKKLVLQ